MVDRKHVEAFEKKTREFLAGKAEKPGLRKVSDVIETDQTLRPYSVRLSSKELLEIKQAARDGGVSTSEFVRRLLIEGVERQRGNTPKELEPEVLAQALNEIRDVLGKAGVVPISGPKVLIQRQGGRKGTSPGPGKGSTGNL